MITKITHLFDNRKPLRPLGSTAVPPPAADEQDRLLGRQTFAAKPKNDANAMGLSQENRESIRFVLPRTMAVTACLVMVLFSLYTAA